MYLLDQGTAPLSICASICLVRASLAALVLVYEGFEWLVLNPSDIESLCAASAWRKQQL